MISTTTSKPLILASSSPYRRELLERLGLHFEVISPEVDEAAETAPDADTLSRRLALAKARAVAAEHPGAVVIGSDQVAECDGRRLGKPGSVERAVEQLEFTSGCEVTFHTAVAVLAGEFEECRGVPTRVRMRALTPQRIHAYVRADRPLNCAGALKSESLGIALARSMTSDDPTALVGLPLIATAELLERAGLTILPG
ncbi:MAG: Maf family protein [Wenzhouxiangella sp.]